jgi:RNA polymerase sigma-70 factor, ECF subfamily
LNFESVYRAHYDFVWRMLRRLGVSSCHLEDACQTVFLTAYRRLPNFEGRSSVKTWLCGIALRVASDHRRSAAVRLERLVDPTADEKLASHDLQQLLERRERLVELDAILSQLSPDHLTVFVLHEFEQFSGEEIAQLIEVPLGTVRSRLRLARQAFSRILEQRRRTAHKVAAGGEP